MIPEWGNFALILACCLAIAQMVLPLAGAALGRNAWMAVARPAAAGQLAFLGIAFACLTYSFVMDDFSVS
jgi:cytochrome c-type biogenesis protein CcmF